MLLLLIYMALALGISFLCSIAEAVLLSVTPGYIAWLEQQGQPSGLRLARLKANVDRPLAAILSLNTIANTAGATAVGAQAANVFGSGAVGIVSAVLTLSILICSEIVPKTLGSVYWRPLGGPVSWGVLWLTRILLPLVLVAERITRLIARGKGAHSFSRAEFSALAHLGARRGHLSTPEYRILDNLLRFEEGTVEQIMTPRTVVFALQQDRTVGDVFEDCRHAAFSRIPVYGRDLDDIIGFVLRRDILLQHAIGARRLPLTALRRPLRVLPESSSLVDAYEFLLDHGDHMAVAVDEYGGCAGIVTLEDLIETLLGREIVDETDANVDMRAFARARHQAKQIDD